MSNTEALLFKLMSALGSTGRRLRKRKQRDELVEIYPWLESMFPDETECVIRILMVADGALSFREGARADPFGLSKMIDDAFGQELVPCELFDIKRAHRFPEANAGEADTFNFKFDAPPANPLVPQFNRENYDQVWLFGMSADRPISDAEVNAIADFMRRGGGVFATGDHRELGRAMCGRLPRVRSMRSWTNPSREGLDRLDTRRIGAAPPFTQSDEEDEFPQIIHPKLYADSQSKSLRPHPLFEMEGGRRIRILPDHMHEGMCPELGPQELKDSFLPGSTEAEFPVSKSTGRKVRPEVVALSTAPSWLFPFEEEQEGVMQRCFGAVSVYDGHEVEQGRVVVDASFHHFTNAQLSSLGSEDYKALRRYHRNIAIWLAPPAMRRLRYLKLLTALRYTYPLIEEIPPRASLVGKDLPLIGARVRKAIADRLSPAEAIECALSLIGWPNNNRLTGTVINPWLPYEWRVDETSGLLDPEEVTNLVLGGAMWALVAELPQDPFEASNALQNKLTRDGLESAITNRVETVVNSLAPVIGRFSKAVDELYSAFTIDVVSDEDRG